MNKRFKALINSIVAPIDSNLSSEELKACLLKGQEICPPSEVDSKDIFQIYQRRHYGLVINPQVQSSGFVDALAALKKIKGKIILYSINYAKKSFTLFIEPDYSSIIGCVWAESIASGNDKETG